MNYLLIENKGEIDVNALILMGGSTKREDETKIGMFGSGNKYAIALLMKEKIDFRIFSGDKEVIFETESVSFRDKTFDKIKINGQDTSLTTDMGPQWRTWQAVREFVSNAIDEGGSTFVNSTTTIEPKEGYTRIYLSHIPEVKEVVDNWDTYFAFDRSDEVLSVVGNKVYPQTSPDETVILYRKGIRCYAASYSKALFHYDLKDFGINETRVIEDTYIAKYKICVFLSENATVEIAYRILSYAVDTGFWEWGFTWRENLNPNWRTAIGHHIIVVRDAAGWFSNEMALYPYFLVTTELAKAIQKSFPDVKVYGIRGSRDFGIFRTIPSTPKMEYMIKKALEFLKLAEYEVNYSIRVGQFDKENQLGGVGINEIHLSEKVFDLGMKELVMTIVEENEHLRTNLMDCSREFQNHWIKLFITEKENRFAYFL